MGLPESEFAGRLEFECTDRLLELHAEYDVAACLPSSAPRRSPASGPTTIRRRSAQLHAAGHEIASHGFAHEWVPELDGAALHEMLVRSRSALEECVGRR